jgi:hypothetical protein
MQASPQQQSFRSGLSHFGAAVLSTIRFCSAREAEQYRAEEQQAALVLQACWRGCLQRQEIDKLR